MTSILKLILLALVTSLAACATTIDPADLYHGTDTTTLPAGTAVQIAQSAAPKAGVGATGVGAGLGMAVVDAIIAADRGRIGFQPPVVGLREAAAAK